MIYFLKAVPFVKIGYTDSLRMGVVARGRRPLRKRQSPLRNTIASLFADVLRHWAVSLPLRYLVIP